MTETPSLQDIRYQIDSIDEAVHDLLMRRTALVRTIGAAKQAEAPDGDPRRHPMRPAREAEILRRLIARHEGPLPVETLVGIWRALIAAMTRLQGPLEIAVFGGSEPVAHWDLARVHFGTATPMVLYQSAGQVFRAISEARGVLGVLPLGTQDGAAPWWPHLLGAGENGPSIVARLPFLRPAGGAQHEALVVGALEREPTGEDSSFLIVSADASVSRGTLVTRLADCGLAGQWLENQESGPQSDRLHLMRVSGFITRDDPRLERLLSSQRPHIHSISVVGSYAEPLQPERPAAEAAAAAS